MKRVDLLDYGRFLAALSVVSFHYLFNGIANGKISSISHVAGLVDIVKYGYLGVEFFFMISGYVIFFSAKSRSAKDFAVSRAIRLLPAFWFAVLFTSSFAYFWGGDLMGVHAKQVMVNLTMLAQPLGFAPVDGVYWTLALELSFYALVFMLLLLGFASKLELFFLSWPFLVLFTYLIGHSQVPLFSGYYSFFAAGCVLAMLKDKRSNLLIIALVVSMFNCLLFATGKGLKNLPGHELATPVVAGAIVVFFIFFIAANNRQLSDLQLPKARLFGGLTYPLYLVHAHVGYMIISEFANEGNKLAVTAGALCFALLVAYFIHAFVESRLASYWRALFEWLLCRPIVWASESVASLRFWIVKMIGGVASR